MQNGLKLLVASLIAIVILSLILVWNGSKKQGYIQFYCAAGLKSAITEIAKQYEEDYGVGIQIDSAGSGALYSKLEITPKGDIYLAADQSYINLAKEKGFVKEDFIIAKQTPVILVSKGNPKSITSVEDLITIAGLKIALANDSAAIGKICRNALSESGQWHSLKVKAEQNGVNKATVPELAIDVQIGTVDAAIVWDTTAKQFPELEMIYDDYLSTFNSQISLGLLKNSTNRAEALKFIRYLRSSDKGLKILQEKGFEVIDGEEWKDE